MTHGDRVTRSMAPSASCNGSPAAATATAACCEAQPDDGQPDRARAVTRPAARLVPVHRFDPTQRSRRRLGSPARGDLRQPVSQPCNDPAAWAREREAEGWDGVACADHYFSVGRASAGSRTSGPASARWQRSPRVCASSPRSATTSSARRSSSRRRCSCCSRCRAAGPKRACAGWAEVEVRSAGPCSRTAHPGPHAPRGAADRPGAAGQRDLPLRRRPLHHRRPGARAPERDPATWWHRSEGRGR